MVEKYFFLILNNVYDEGKQLMKHTNEYLLHKSVNFLFKKSNQHPYVLNYRDFDMSVRWVLMKKLIALLKNLFKFNIDSTTH